MTGKRARQTEREYMRSMLAGCSLDDWVAIVRTAVARAKEGDARARDWLSSYLLGKPAGEAPTLLSLLVDELTGRDRLREAITEACTTDGVDELVQSANKRVDQAALQAALDKLEK